PRQQGPSATLAVLAATGRARLRFSSPWAAGWAGTGGELGGGAWTFAQIPITTPSSPRRPHASWRRGTKKTLPSLAGSFRFATAGNRAALSGARRGGDGLELGRHASLEAIRRPLVERTALRRLVCHRSKTIVGLLGLGKVTRLDGC